jgi:hypothetical protein
MLSDQFGAYVLRGASRLVVQIEAVFLRGQVESGLRISGSKAFEELLVGR